MRNQKYPNIYITDSASETAASIIQRSIDPAFMCQKSTIKFANESIVTFGKIVDRIKDYFSHNSSPVFKVGNYTVEVLVIYYLKVSCNNCNEDGLSVLADNAEISADEKELIEVWNDSIIGRYPHMFLVTETTKPPFVVFQELVASITESLSVINTNNDRSEGIYMLVMGYSSGVDFPNILS